MVSTGLKSLQKSTRSGQGSAQARSILETMDLSAKEMASLIRAAEKILHNPEDAEDAVQSALLNAWKYRERFRGDCSVLTYLTACVRNASIMQLRSRHEFSSINPEWIAIVPRFEEVIDQRRRLRSAVISISPRFKDIFRMLADGHDYMAIALKLQAPVGTIKAQVFRARQRLKARAA